MPLPGPVTLRWLLLEGLATLYFLLATWLSGGAPGWLGAALIGTAATCADAWRWHRQREADK